MWKAIHSLNIYFFNTIRRGNKIVCKKLSTCVSLECFFCIVLPSFKMAKLNNYYNFHLNSKQLLGSKQNEHDAMKLLFGSVFLFSLFCINGSHPSKVNCIAQRFHIYI